MVRNLYQREGGVLEMPDREYVYNDKTLSNSMPSHGMISDYMRNSQEE